jgi:hypothetical protein
MSTKYFVDECNNESAIVAFSGAKLCRLQNNQIVDVVDLTDVDAAATSDADIYMMQIPKVSSRRNVGFCVDKSGKLIVVCLLTMMKVLEWRQVFFCISEIVDVQNS